MFLLLALLSPQGYFIKKLLYVYSLRVILAATSSWPSYFFQNMELEAFVMVMLFMYLSTLDQLGIVAHQITRGTSVCKQLWEICLFAMLQWRVRVFVFKKI